MFRLLHMMALRAALLTVLADFKVLAVSEAQVPPRTLAIMIGTSVLSLSFLRLSIPISPWTILFYVIVKSLVYVKTRKKFCYFQKVLYLCRQEGDINISQNLMRDFLEIALRTTPKNTHLGHWATRPLETSQGSDYLP